MEVATRGRGQWLRHSCFTVDPDETRYGCLACRVDQTTGVREGELLHRSA